MIKWFDADKFLPGRDCKEVLARVIKNNVVNMPEYYMARFQDGDWGSDSGLWLEDDASKVTHWAHINEPFE